MPPSFASAKIWPIKALDLPALSRNLFLRAALDSIEGAATPSLAEGSPVDSPGYVAPRLGVDDDRVGIQVGAQSDSVDELLGPGISVHLFTLGLRWPKSYALADLCERISASVSSEALVACALSISNLIPCNLGRFVFGHPKHAHVAEVDLGTTGLLLEANRNVRMRPPTS